MKNREFSEISGRRNLQNLYLTDFLTKNENLTESYEAIQDSFPYMNIFFDHIGN